MFNFNFTPINQRTETTKTGFDQTFGQNLVNSLKSTSGKKQTTSSPASTSTPTPTPAPTPNTPVGDIFRDPTIDETPIPKWEDVDEDKIRRETIQRYQGQIDATKAAYSTLLGQTQLQGQGRLGEGVAQQARGGLLGSDFGQAQTDKTRQLNQSQEQQVLESQATAIASIMAQANADANAEISGRRAAKQYGYEALKEYNAAEQERKQNNLKKLASSFLLQNIDPTTIGGQLKDLAKKYKVSENDIINAYLEEQRANVGTSEFKTVGKDSMIYDPKTGEFIMPPTADGGMGGKTQYSIDKMNQTLSSAQNLLAMAEQDPSIFGRSAAVPLPDAVRSDAFRNYKAALKQLKANIAFNELTAMREASKTGGALGQVSNIELGLLESSLGALDMDQSPENVQKNLQQIISSINNFQQAVQQYGGGSMGATGDDVFAEEW